MTTLLANYLKFINGLAHFHYTHGVDGVEISRTQAANAFQDIIQEFFPRQNKMSGEVFGSIVDGIFQGFLSSIQ